MKVTNENSFNEITIGNFTDDFLLLMLKNMNFRKRELEVDIETVENEMRKRGIGFV